MFFALIFVSWRIFQIITLIPVVGMLGYFVNKFSSANALTPDSILILFIVSVLAFSWAVLTLFFYHRSSHNARFVSLVDMLIFGALIAGIYYLRAIGNANCTNVSFDTTWVVRVGQLTVSGPGGFDVATDKSCAMLKASWAFAIMNCIAFFFSGVVAWLHGDREEDVDVVRYTTTRSSRGGHHHSSRHSHRSRSGSRHSRGSYDRRRVYV